MPKHDDYKPVCDFVCDTYVRLKDSEQFPEEGRAVMKELTEKSQELMDNLKSGNRDKVMETIIEIEQAADSALRFAKSSDDVNQDIQAQVQAVHDKLASFKKEHLH